LLPHPVGEFVLIRCLGLRAGCSIDGACGDVRFGVVGHSVSVIVEPIEGLVFIPEDWNPFVERLPRRAGPHGLNSGHTFGAAESYALWGVWWEGTGVEGPLALSAEPADVQKRPRVRPFCPFGVKIVHLCFVFVFFLIHYV